MDELLGQLQEIGFSQYEARAYVALLMHAPVTGYELSKRSGVPRSMVYETLGKLIERGAAHIIPSEPVAYAPVPAGEFVDRVRERTDNRFEFLARELSALERSPEVEVIRHVRGEPTIMAEILDVIEHARRELWLCVWAPEVPAIKEAVDRAERRGVRVFSVLFEDDETQLGTTYRHSFLSPEVVRERLGGRLTIASRDAEEVVIAEFIGPTGSWAVKTKDRALVLIASDYVRHDIVVDVIVSRHGIDLETMWRSDPVLVEILTAKPRAGGDGKTAKRAPRKLTSDGGRRTRQGTAKR